MKYLYVLIFIFCGIEISLAQLHPKREFRGVWIHTINQNQYKTMSTPEMKEYFIKMLNDLQQGGINAIIFQIRPCADAFYYSEIEPWSRYLTGRQGQAPFENFDPMSFLIQESHRRCMEFHAWLNPYRVKTSKNEILDPRHLYFKHPEWFIYYGKGLFLNPGLKECRQFICNIVKDIVTRYDIDAIHMDDYFYPYPIAYEKFQDEETFEKVMGQELFLKNKEDWRRENVNCLIREIKETIISKKKWVRFGISPFGIYRNKTKAYPNGSNTNGLQAYETLYSDVQLWAKMGWIDYLIPQLYWEIGNKVADYKTLINWWVKNKITPHLYVGQDINRSIYSLIDKDFKKTQLSEKLNLTLINSKIDGNCFWSAYDLLKNNHHILDSLKKYYYYHQALVPAYSHLCQELPKEVKSLKIYQKNGNYFLEWEQIEDSKGNTNTQYFIIYRFLKNENIDLQDPSKIIKITRENRFKLSLKTNNFKKSIYIVTTVDRYHNESPKGLKTQIKE